MTAKKKSKSRPSVRSAEIEFVPVQHEGRSAQRPLYVMLTEEQFKRFKAGADAANMSMREYVVNALDAQVSTQELWGATVRSAGSMSTSVTANAELMRSELALRLNVLEKKLDALQARVQRIEPLEFPPKEWFDEDGNLKNPEPPKNG